MSPGNPAFQGTGTGFAGYPGTRTTHGPVYVQAGLTKEDVAHFDRVSLRELQPSNGTSLRIPTQDPPSVLD